jgi:hypothetical protein
MTAVESLRVWCPFLEILKKIIDLIRYEHTQIIDPIRYEHTQIIDPIRYEHTQIIDPIRYEHTQIRLLIGLFVFVFD